MTKIQNSKQKNNRFKPVWSLRFIWNLMLEICDLFVICLPAVLLAGCLEYGISKNP